jgi:threonine dehydrogenase-like Zn-dependent dehydrogenase
MASPITLTTAAVVVVPFNARRRTLMLQNTGATNAVYVKKQIPGAAASIPSATNYDFVLAALGTENNIVKINSAASFMAVAAAATTTLAYMETAAGAIV